MFVCFSLDERLIKANIFFLSFFFFSDLLRNNTFCVYIYIYIYSKKAQKMNPVIKVNWSLKNFKHPLRTEIFLSRLDSVICYLLVCCCASCRKTVTHSSLLLFIQNQKGNHCSLVPLQEEFLLPSYRWSFFQYV